MSPVPVLPGRRNHGLPDYAWGFGASMDGNREKIVTLWMVAVDERIHSHHVVDLRAGSPCLEWFVLDGEKPTLHPYDLTLSIHEGRNFISWKIPRMLILLQNFDGRRNNGAKLAYSSPFSRVPIRPCRDLFPFVVSYRNFERFHNASRIGRYW
ncbi:hypothetical protein CPC08DRAFT_731690 [Agrocybe pediades]|nr:hypothetical protein CPC08DRAFT_731690 [Agrocybe pediades]